MKAKIQALLWAQRHMLAAMSLAFVAGVIVTSLWIAYERYQFKKQEQALRIVIEQKNILLRQKAEFAVKASILEASDEGLRKTLLKQQDQLNEQDRALDFYKQLMDPANVNKGLVLNSYAITQVLDRLYDVKLVFVQYATRRSYMQADLKVELKGQMQGKSKTLVLSDLLSEEQVIKKQKLSFRYFQSFERQLILPEGFEPQLVLLSARIKNKSTSLWHKEIPWIVEEI